MRIIKNILAVSVICFAFTACYTKGEGKVYAPGNDNYVVLLDLSDRIIQPSYQVSFDTSAIRAVFEKFERSVQHNIVVKSADKFCLRIIPQKKSALPGNSFEDLLSIDMGKYKAADKLIKLNEFRARFSAGLAQLYKQANLGTKGSDYAGVDIWQYFNEQMNTDLSANCNNKVLILTDGYFDFEDRLHGMSNNGEYTTTAPLLAKLKVPNWKKIWTDKQLGIIPVQLTVPAKWLVCGIQTKASSTDLLEAEKLCFIWENWLRKSGATQIAKPVIYTSSEKVKNLIAINL